jgi:sulfhydrogenase subunit beta (sulfur reductase)
MMKRLKKDNILPLLKEINQEKRVFCPQKMGGNDLMLVPLGEGEYTGEIGKTTISAKNILFPQTEEINIFRTENIYKVIDTTETILFGIRPCEMKALRFVDRFMTRDGFIDPHYISRRENVTAVVIACNEPPSPTCFCVDAGGMPYLEKGYDVQLFDIGNSYIAIAGSEKGEKILLKKYFEQGCEEDDNSRLEEIKNIAIRSQKNRPGMSKAISILKENEPDETFWEGLALRCINCGGCVYVCPTCTCFNVYDLASHGGYIRYRSWDACLHAGFTRETSGHNPRPTQGSRLARRHEHKLKFDIIKFKESGCVGCGRCSDTCPVGLGAIEIIKELNRL